MIEKVHRGRPRANEASKEGTWRQVEVEVSACGAFGAWGVGVGTDKANRGGLPFPQLKPTQLHGKSTPRP